MREIVAFAEAALLILLLGIVALLLGATILHRLLDPPQKAVLEMPITTHFCEPSGLCYVRASR